MNKFDIINLTRAYIGYNKNDTICLLLAYNGCLLFALYGFSIISYLTRLMEAI